MFMVLYVILSFVFVGYGFWVGFVFRFIVLHVLQSKFMLLVDCFIPLCWVMVCGFIFFLQSKFMLSVRLFHSSLFNRGFWLGLWFYVFYKASYQYIYLPHCQECYNEFVDFILIKIFGPVIK